MKTAEPESTEPDWNVEEGARCSSAKWRRALSAAATAVMLAGSAAAADLAQEAPVAWVPAGAPAYDWTGFYLGGHMGYAWGNSKWTASPASAPGTVIDSGSFSISQPVNIFDESGSWFEGVQAGYNYMFPNRLVIGAEADASFSAFQSVNTGLSTGGAAIAPNSFAYYSDNIYASGTVRGRIGYAPGNWLFYATGGLAWTSEQYSLISLLTGTTESHFAARLGWTAGGGIEAPLTPSWTIRAEYLYTGYGNSIQNFPSSGQRFTSNLSEQEARVGLNYQFAGGGPLSEKDAPKPVGLDPDSIAVHGDITAFWQGYPAFHSPYELLPPAGRSLPGSGLAREVMDAGLDVGVRLWSGAEFWVNPEIEQGFGPGNTSGVAGYPNAGAYKVGQAEPYARVNRFIIRQEIDLGGETQTVPAGFLNFAGTQTSDRLVLTAGKFTPLDIFDRNTYLNPKTGFFNWQMNLSLPYDFAGDAWTVTYGAAAEWYTGNWTFRAGIFDLSKQPEGGLGAIYGISDDPNFSQYNLVGEIEHRHELWGQPGAIKVLGYFDRGRMATYEDAIAWGIANNTAADVDEVRKYRTKPGAVLNLEQKITSDVAVFAEAGWMNGKYEIFDTSDVDRSVMAGLQIFGNRWGRPDDTIGIAGAIDAISKDYQAYLAAGGGGVVIGDGQLPHHGTENIFEIYYNYTMSSWASVALDYQFIQNPAYNTDRGPANFFGGRAFLHF